MNRFRIRWYVIVGFAFLGVMGIGTIRLLRSEPSNRPRPEDVVKAGRSAVALKGTGDERDAEKPAGSVSGIGVIEPRDRVTNVGAPVAGRIAKVLVTEGQRVNAGDELLELDNAVERAVLAAAAADFLAANAQLARVVRGSRVQEVQAATADADAARARADLSKAVAERLSQAAASGAVTPDELERATGQARADLSSALAAEARAHAVLAGSRQEDVKLAHAQADAVAARRDEAQAKLDGMIVRAPSAGEVLQVLVRPGEFYQTGADPLVVMGDTRELRVRMDVDERDVGRIAIGNAVTVRANAFAGVDFTGKVIEIGRRMGRKNVRTDDPTERTDTKILEVLVALDSPKGLIIGQRVICYVQGRPVGAQI